MCLVIYNRFLIFIFILCFIFLKVVTQDKVIYMACIVTVIIFFLENATLSLTQLSVCVCFPVCGTFLFMLWSFHTLWSPFKIYDLQWNLQYLKSIENFICPSTYGQWFTIRTLLYMHNFVAECSLLKCFLIILLPFFDCFDFSY